MTARDGWRLEPHGDLVLLRCAALRGIPSVAHAFSTRRSDAGDFDLGGHEQTVPRPQADPHLRVVAHQVGDVQAERRDFVDPHRSAVRGRQAGDFGLVGFAEQSMAEFGEEVHGIVGRRSAAGR